MIVLHTSKRTRITFNGSKIQKELYMVVALYFITLFSQLGYCREQTSSSKNIDLLWYVGHVFKYNLTNVVSPVVCNISAVRVVNEFGENSLPYWIHSKDEFSFHGYSPQPDHVRFTMLLFGKKFGYYVRLCYTLVFNIHIVSSSSSLQNTLYNYLRETPIALRGKNWSNCAHRRLNILTLSFSTGNASTDYLIKHGEHLSEVLELEYHLLQILPPNSPYVLYKQLHTLNVVVSSVTNNENTITFSWPLKCDSMASDSAAAIHRYRRALDVVNSTFSNFSGGHITEGRLPVKCENNIDTECGLFFSSILAYVQTPMESSSATPFHQTAAISSSYSFLDNNSDLTVLHISTRNIMSSVRSSQVASIPQISSKVKSYTSIQTPPLILSSKPLSISAHHTVASTQQLKSSQAPTKVFENSLTLFPSSSTILTHSKSILTTIGFDSSFATEQSLKISDNNSTYINATPSISSPSSTMSISPSSTMSINPTFYHKNASVVVPSQISTRIIAMSTKSLFYSPTSSWSSSNETYVFSSTVSFSSPHTNVTHYLSVPTTHSLKTIPFTMKTTPTAPPPLFPSSTKPTSTTYSSITSFSSQTNLSEVSKTSMSSYLSATTFIASTPSNFIASTPSNFIASTSSNFIASTPSNFIASTPSNFIASTPSNFIASTPSNFIASTPSNFIASTPSNVIASTPSNFIASTRSNFIASTPSNFIASTSSNFIANTPSNFIASTSSNFIASTPSNFIASTPSNFIASTPSNSIASTPSNVIASTPSNFIASTPSNFIASTPSNFIASTPSNFIANTPSNFIASTPSNFIASTPSNFIASTPSNFIASTPSNFIASTPSYFIASTPSNFIASTPSNFIASTPSNFIASTPSNSIASTPSNFIASTPSNVIASTPSNFIASTPSNFIASTPSNFIASTPSNFIASTPSYFIASTPSNFIASTPSNFIATSSKYLETTFFVNSTSITMTIPTKIHSVSPATTNAISSALMTTTPVVTAAIPSTINATTAITRAARTRTATTSIYPKSVTSSNLFSTTTSNGSDKIVETTTVLFTTTGSIEFITTSKFGPTPSATRNSININSSRVIKHTPTPTVTALVTISLPSSIITLGSSSTVTPGTTLITKPTTSFLSPTTLVTSPLTTPNITPFRTSVKLSSTTKFVQITATSTARPTMTKVVSIATTIVTALSPTSEVMKITTADVLVSSTTSSSTTVVITMPSTSSKEIRVITTNVLSATSTTSTHQTSTRLPPVTDSAPVISYPIVSMNVNAGRLFEYSVPKKTFYDAEDGDTRNLTLIALTSVNPFQTLSWIYFNQSAQKFIFMPLETDYNVQAINGLASIHLKATDCQGRYVIDVFTVTIQPIIIAVQFSVSLIVQMDYDVFMSDIKTRIKVMQQITKYYGDNTTNPSLLLLSIRKGSTVVTLTNSSISGGTCDNQNINRFVDIIKVTGSNSPQSGFQDTMQYSITEIIKKYYGVCVSVTPGSQSSESQLKYIIPIITLCIILSIVLIIVLCLCRKNRKRQKGSFYLYGRKYKNGRPVLLPDEIELKNLSANTKVHDNYGISCDDPYDVDDEVDGATLPEDRDSDNTSSSDSSYSSPYHPPPRYSAPPPYLFSFDDGKSDV